MSGGESAARRVVPAHIEFSFAPNVAFVSLVRKFVADFCRYTLGRDALGARIGLAVHEMLENSCRYSIDGESRMRVEFAPRGGATRFVITTRNRADEGQRAELARRFDVMKRAPDPFAYYQDVLVRSLEVKDRSGLGLARIWWEAEMDLDIAFEDEWVEIRATGELDPAGVAS